MGRAPPPCDPHSTMKPLHGLVWAGALRRAGRLIGCKGSGKPRVAFVSNNPDPFWTIAEAGTKKAAAESRRRGALPQALRRATPRRRRRSSTPSSTRASRPSPSASSTPRTRPTTSTRSPAKVPLLTQDNDAPKTKRLLHRHRQLRGRPGRRASSSRRPCPTGGTVVIFVGQLEPLNARAAPPGRDRRAGRRQGAEGPTEFKPRRRRRPTASTSSYEQTYTDQPEGGQKCQGECRRRPDQAPGRGERLHGRPVGLQPAADPGAVKDKVKDAGASIKIVGFDEDPATLDGIKDG